VTEAERFVRISTHGVSGRPPGAHTDLIDVLRQGKVEEAFEIADAAREGVPGVSGGAPVIAAKNDSMAILAEGAAPREIDELVARGDEIESSPEDEADGGSSGSELETRVVTRSC
jgi:hypothetical protein